LFMVDDVVLSVVAEHGEEGCAGRTRIQKYGYFIGLRLDIDAGFINHCFGPYSPLATRRLNALVRCGILEEGRDGHEEKESAVWVNDKMDFHYTYLLSEEGRRFFDWRRSEESAAYRRAAQVLEQIRGLCNDDLLTLVVAAKLHQVSRVRDDWKTVADGKVLSQWLNYEVKESVVTDSSTCMTSLLENPSTLAGVS